MHATKLKLPKTYLTARSDPTPLKEDDCYDSWIDETEENPEYIDEDTYGITLLAHKILYISKLHTQR